MSQPTTSPEMQKWHKEVAMRCNNRAWALAVQTRNRAEDREMLDAAHTAAYHWAQIGTELNRMRAAMLLAEAHALLGNGAFAFTLATEMRQYFIERSDTPDWELAFTHTVYAHCAHTAGNDSAYRRAYQDAATALAAVADEEDRKVVEQTFVQVPVP